MSTSFWDVKIHDDKEKSAKQEEVEPVEIKINIDQSD